MLLIGTLPKMMGTTLLKTILLVSMILMVSSCRKPSSWGFYQPFTLATEVPDGPPEYKAGWYSGCKSAVGGSSKSFANSFVYQQNKGPEFMSGVYAHDSAYQTGWGQGWFACTTHIGNFGASPAFSTYALE